MHGAITMACQACYRSGIGTLTCMIPDCIQNIFAQKTEFAMNLSTPSRNGIFDSRALDILKDHRDRYDILSIGNGMSKETITEQMVCDALHAKACVILDADACWGVRHHLDLLNRDEEAILTPHVKEMTYLCERSLQDILKDPFGTVHTFCQRYPNCTLILKSDVTLVGHRDQIGVLYAPNSAMAKGGSGDILCGIVTGLYGQCREAFSAALTGVYIHAACGRIKKDPASVLPQDLLNQISIVFSSLREG